LLGITVYTHSYSYMGASRGWGEGQKELKKKDEIELSSPLKYLKILPKIHDHFNMANMLHRIQNVIW
jgi:hypothetical protein